MSKRIVVKVGSGVLSGGGEGLSGATLRRLAGEIAKHKENPELAGAGDREILKAAIRSINYSAAPDPQAAAAAPAQVSQYLPVYAANAAAEVKLEIEYLVDLALREGIAKANHVALKSSPFVLDAFHDALAGKLYPELQRRKLLP